MLQKKNLLKKDENFIERFNFIVNSKQAPIEINLKYYSFFYLSFLLWTFTIHRTAVKEEVISLIPLYHLHPLHRRLDINRSIAAESSPLRAARS